MPSYCAGCLQTRLGFYIPTLRSRLRCLQQQPEQQQTGDCLSEAAEGMLFTVKGGVDDKRREHQIENDNNPATQCLFLAFTQPPLSPHTDGVMKQNGTS